jgi:hypothetical protein
MTLRGLFCALHATAGPLAAYQDDWSTVSHTFNLAPDGSGGSRSCLRGRTSREIPPIATPGVMGNTPAIWQTHITAGTAPKYPSWTPRRTSSSV